MSRRLGVAEAIVDGRRIPGDVALADGAVAEVGLLPLGAGTAIAGLVDLQVNGFGGVDLLSADDAGWAQAGEALLRTGVTSYLPTLITAPAETTTAALARADRLMRRGDPGPPGARILGVHLEGPFISPKRLGVHPPEHRRDPDPALLDRLLAAGPVAMVTLAPELPGAEQLLDRLLERGIVVSVGHSAAPAEVAAAAFRRGARAVTHLFNAMEPLRARDPGVVGAALVDERVAALCIVDGVHLAEENVRLIFGRRRGTAVLTSDAIAPACTGSGDFTLAGEPISVSDGRATRSDGTLAGSVAPMVGAIPRLVDLGVPLEEAVTAATAAPARLLGRANLGSIAPGARADLVVLDDSLVPAAVFQAGRLVAEGAG